MSRPVNQLPHWPDARGWIGIATFALTVMLLWMMKDQSLRESEFFKTIATLIIGTAFVNGVVSWAFSATKGGGEQAEVNARIAEKLTTSAADTATAAADQRSEPQPVTIENKPTDPVPTTDVRP